MRRSLLLGSLGVAAPLRVAGFLAVSRRARRCGASASRWPAMTRRLENARAGCTIGSCRADELRHRFSQRRARFGSMLDARKSFGITMRLRSNPVGMRKTLHEADVRRSDMHITWTSTSLGPTGMASRDRLLLGPKRSSRPHAGQLAMMASEHAHATDEPVVPRRELNPRSPVRHSIGVATS